MPQKKERTKGGKLEGFRKILLAEYVRRFRTLPRKFRPTIKTDDVLNSDNDEIDVQMDVGKAMRVRDECRAIELALFRLNEGTFGLCRECGDKIPSGRLKSMPWADLCITCKQAEETQEKSRRIVFSPVGYKRPV